MAATNTADDALAVRERFRQYLAAWSPGGEPADFDTRFAPLYVRSDDFVAYDFLPPVEGYFGWDRYRSAMRETLAGVAEFTLQPNDDVRIGLLGDAAWSSASFRVHTRSHGGREADIDGRVSLVWVRRDGNWLVAHEHVSTPLPSSG